MKYRFFYNILFGVITICLIACSKNKDESNAPERLREIYKNHSLVNSFEYDNKGRVSEITIPDDGYKIAYIYNDQTDNLSQIKEYVGLGEPVSYDVTYTNNNLTINVRNSVFQLDTKGRLIKYSIKESSYAYQFSVDYADNEEYIVVHYGTSTRDTVFYGAALPSYRAMPVEFFIAYTERFNPIWYTQFLVNKTISRIVKVFSSEYYEQYDYTSTFNEHYNRAEYVYDQYNSSYVGTTHLVYW